MPNLVHVLSFLSPVGVPFGLQHVALISWVA